MRLFKCLAVTKQHFAAVRNDLIGCHGIAHAELVHFFLNKRVKISLQSIADVVCQYVVISFAPRLYGVRDLMRECVTENSAHLGGVVCCIGTQIYCVGLLIIRAVYQCIPDALPV